MLNPTRALYYPYIHFQSVEWLKSALLYWEAIERIVPYAGYEANDPPEVQELQDAGCIEDIAAEPFTERVAEEYAARRATWGEKPTRDEALERIRIAVHDEKFSRSFAMDLLEHGFALQRGEWLEIDARFAVDYMAFLANVISGEHNAPTVTERFAHEVERSKQEFGLGREGNLKSGIKLVWATCSFPSPEALVSTPVERILKFRESHLDERRTFRNYMQTLASDLAQLPSPKAVKDALADRRSEIEASLKQQEETYRAMNIKQLAGAMALSVPSTIATAASTLPPLLQIAIGATALGVGILNVYKASRAERKKAKASFPLHYLISLEADLKLDGLQERYMRRSSRYFLA
jgi:hypothetical protein